jgi:hypothetical protein
MSEYVNGFRINVNDIARIEFLDDKAQGKFPEEIVEIAMQFQTFKMLCEGMGKVIAEHEIKLAQAEEDRKKAN